jgi:hypothetical protein
VGRVRRYDLVAIAKGNSSYVLLGKHIMVTGKWQDIQKTVQEIGFIEAGSEPEAIVKFMNKYWSWRNDRS